MVPETSSSARIILQQQADLFTRHTGRRLVGEVSTRVLGRDFAHTFYITAPELDNYRHFVVRIRHYVDTLYPVRVARSEKDETGDQCHDAEEFLAWLRGVFAEQRTLEMVRVLLAQCQDTPDGDDKGR